MTDKKINITTKKLVVSAALIALGFVASVIKFASLPFGGSITMFSMLFISLIGYFYGWKIGITAGVAYGLIQFATNPYFFVLIQVLLDYPLAFGALGLSGFFAGRKHGLIWGYVAGCVGRYIFHVISGYVFFKEYTPEGMNDLLYAMGYNATYILPEVIVTVIILLIPQVNKGISQLKKAVNN